MSKSIKLIISIVLLQVFMNITYAKEVRALWVMPWNLTNTKQIDELITDAVENNQNEILAEVRYRADALYIPNKSNSLYNNPEPRSHILKNDDFDPLEYLLNKAHNYGLTVQAWISVLNVTPTNRDLIRSNYIYQNHNSWIMTDSYGTKMNGANYMGNFIDPGILEVRNHLLNVILDIVVNYPELDGIHLDYIRYPARQYGYSKESVQRFKAASSIEKIDWNDWRILQINDFLSELRVRAKLIHPGLLITAAVIADVWEAKVHYAQDWTAWLNDGLIDLAYPMAYAKDYNNFNNILNTIGSKTDKEKVVVGLRAWQEYFPRIDYKVERIIDKAKLCRQEGYAGLAFFSYEGLKKSGFFSELSVALFDWKEQELTEFDEDNFISQLTSRYSYTLDTDTLNINLENDNIRSIEVIEQDEQSDLIFKAKARCEAIDYKNNKFFITFYFETESTWLWNISDVTGNVIYNKKKHYPRGFYTEEWDGLDKDKVIIPANIYVVTIKNSKEENISQKKFVVK